MSDDKNKLVQPSFVPKARVIPEPEAAQLATIRPGSPLAVIGVFVEIIRGRFAPDEMPLYPWNNDIKKTKIAIESAFNEDNGVRNYRPGIFVDRDDQVRGRTVIGDFAAQNLRDSTRGFWALDTVPILIECLAAKKAESAIIADVTSWFLHASSDLIQAAFGFHEMTPVNVSRTQPVKRDKDEWLTGVTFSVQYNARWTNKKAAPLIRDLLTRITATDAESATEYFEQVVLGPRTK